MILKVIILEYYRAILRMLAFKKSYVDSMPRWMEVTYSAMGWFNLGIIGYCIGTGISNLF